MSNMSMVCSKITTLMDKFHEGYKEISGVLAISIIFRCSRTSRSHVLTTHANFQEELPGNSASLPYVLGCRKICCFYHPFNFSFIFLLKFLTILLIKISYYVVTNIIYTNIHINDIIYTNIHINNNHS